MPSLPLVIRTTCCFPQCARAVLDPPGLAEAKLSRAQTCSFALLVVSLAFLCFLKYYLHPHPVPGWLACAVCLHDAAGEHVPWRCIETTGWEAGWRRLS